MIQTPRDLGYRLPGEFEPHARTWMSWPCNTRTYGPHLHDARLAHARVARAIAAFEPVTILTPPVLATEARALLDAQGPSGVDIVEAPLNDSWFRDNGPLFLTGPDGLAAVDWGFNGWGGDLHAYDDDARVARLAIAATGARRFPGPMILEGGSIHGDGQGTLITTQECLLNGNRNPHLTAPDIETVLSEYLGIDRVIWLDQGLQNDGTDGHVDNVCAFAAPGVVLIGAGVDPDDDNTRRLRHNADVLRAATDARGRSVTVIDVPQPAHRADYPPGVVGRGRLPLSYVNFYVCNGAVIVPRYGDPQDEAAAEAIGAAFPGRQVVPVDTLAVAWGGGNIHCITQQQPAA